MGGYGAFKLALRNPQRYAYAASFSGVLDLAQLASEQSPGSTFYDLFRNIFGEDMHIRNTEHDLLHVLETFQGRADTLPKLYQYCGRADFLYGENQTFLKRPGSWAWISPMPRTAAGMSGRSGTTPDGRIHRLAQ